MDTDARRALIDDTHHEVLVTLKRDERPQLSNIAYTLGNYEVIRVSVTASGTRRRRRPGPAP